jgi:heterodisulfide reductase subunit B
MKPYIYYPGCSLEGSAKEYDAATRAFLSLMAVELVELDDWTCCGATAAASQSRLLSLVLPARNLALAEKIAPGADILVPCSACYLNLKQAWHAAESDRSVLAQLNVVLAEEGLVLTGGNAVRHLLDVLTTDIGPTRIAAGVSRPLDGLTIAPYYGCQCLRPFIVFDDPETPVSMEGLISACGADVYRWAMGPACCGASHMNTKMDVGLTLSGAILQAAEGADAIVTVCPMCQMNLEAYQGKLSRYHGRSLEKTVIYLPQLLGLASGLSEKAVGLDLNLAVTDTFRSRLHRGDNALAAAG